MNALGQSGRLLASVVTLTVVITVIITLPSGLSRNTGAGQVAKSTYRAPRTVTYKSDLKTTEAEQGAAAAVTPVYRADATAPSQQTARYTSAFATIDTIRGSEGADKAIQFQQLLPGLAAAEAKALAALDDPSFQALEAAVKADLDSAQGTPVRPEQTGQTETVAAHLSPDVPSALKGPALSLARSLLIPNYVLDQEKTETARRKAAEAVAPVSYTVDKDQVIAYRGQVLSALDVERLQAVGLTRPAISLQRAAGVGLLVLLFSTLLLAVTPRFATPESYPVRTAALLGGFAIAITLAGVLIVPTQPILAYVLPITAPVLLLTIFYGFSFSIIAGVCLTALFALALGGSFELFFIHLAATTAAVLFAGRIRTISGFLRAGALVALLVFIGMVAFKLLAGNFTVLNVHTGASDIPKFLVAAALNGALTASLVFAGIAFLGNVLGRVTFLQLLELESPRQPLLRRLATVAPGTYSHSLRMAGIVEKVSEDIGADPLLARVQTLYHDIGKIALPEYFVENQRHGENLHADLSPKESADILRAHISEGLTLAREYDLPDQVAAVIPEHHGTTLMGFFWSKARQGNKRPNETDYRYYGPTPRTKETAIIMLADAVEAASRTLDQPTEKNIRGLIHDLFTARIDDGQLDHAPLSTNELRIMKEAFAEAVMTDLHKRIRYPRG